MTDNGLLAASAGSALRSFTPATNQVYIHWVDVPGGGASGVSVPVTAAPPPSSASAQYRETERLKTK